jgi:hypothetical protein
MSRLDAMRKKNEELLLRMQFFCIDPKLSNYNEICSNSRIATEQGDYLLTWKMAALHQYGKQWDVPQEEWEENRAKFSAEMKKLYARLLIKPTSSMLDRMWFVFFATGDINALKAVFEVSGNETASRDLQIAASDQFSNFRDEYQRKINEALKRDTNYFHNHETVYGLSDGENMMLQSATVFDRFQQKLDVATKELERQKEEEDELIGKFTRTNADVEDENEGATDATAEAAREFAEDLVGAEETDEERKERERMSKMSTRFDEIARDVLGSKYVTKSVDT